MTYGYTAYQSYGIKELKECKCLDDIKEVIINYESYNRNKKIHPNIIYFIKEKINKETKIDFKNRCINFNNKQINIGLQLMCEYYIIKYIKHNLKKKNKELYDYFFSCDNDFGTKIMNINVEENIKVFMDKNKRIDMIFNFDNNSKIIVEINETKHEKDLYNDNNRLNDIYINNNDIKYILYLKEKFLTKKNIKKIVDKKLLTLILDINYIHDEKKFVINGLKKLNSDESKEWIDILELIYDSHNDKNKPIISIDRLNKFFCIDLTEKFIERGESFYDYEKKLNIKFDNYDIDISSDEDVYTTDEENECENKIEYNFDNLYIIKDKNIVLKWTGFTLYLTTAVKYINDIKKELFFQKFNHAMYTYIIQVLKDRCKQLQEKEYGIWGLDDEDYKKL